MLKRTFTGLAFAAALMTGAAHAADMSAPVYKAPAAAAPLFNWTGFYIGANVGYGSAHADFSVPGATGTDDLNGVIGGGQIGYNWQAGNWIFGLEGDFQGADQHDNTTVTGIGSMDNSVSWFATIRGRVGYAIAPTWMIYATGGGAFANFKSTTTLVGIGTSTSETTNGGWSAGAGIEAAINRNWSWKVEYLHFDVGTF